MNGLFHVLCVDAALNYFELFDLPQKFAVNQDTLTTRYRELQQRYHPDQQQAQRGTADAQGFDASEALRLSTLVNQAHDSLRLPDRRAAYLLQLHGQDQGLAQSIHDLDFLQSALELREQLDEAESAVQLDSLRIEVQQWLDALCNEFQIDLDEQDWIEARDTARKLAFMQRVLADIDRAEDRFDDLDDDDLFSDDF